MKNIYALEAIYFVLGAYVGSLVAFLSFILVSMFSHDEEYKDKHNDYTGSIIPK